MMAGYCTCYQMSEKINVGCQKGINLTKKCDCAIAKMAELHKLHYYEYIVDHISHMVEQQQQYHECMSTLWITPLTWWSSRAMDS